MKVSVIIPVYNVVLFIERCLLSALNQTWNDLEIILVNDCTPDNSMEVVAEVLKVHPRSSIVKIISHQQNKGLSAARNTGIYNSQGDYLYFLDSDDYLPLNSIELLALEAKLHNVDFVIGDCKVVGKIRSIPPLCLPSCSLKTNLDILSTYAKSKWPVMACNKLVKHSFLLNECLYFREGILHEDDLWTFMLACKASNAYIVHEITYYYFMQSNSITGNPSIKNLESRISIIQCIYDFIIKSEDLKKNRWVYITFETLKAKYFDRIIYFTKDKNFHYQSYHIFRDKRYISSIKAYVKFHPHLKLILRNIHYLLPDKIGYLYFKGFVKLSYYCLVLSIKMNNWKSKLI